MSEVQTGPAVQTGPVNNVEKKEGWRNILSGLSGNLVNIKSNVGKIFKPKPEAKFYEPEPEPDPEIQETLSEQELSEALTSCPYKLTEKFKAIVEKYKDTHAKDFLTKNLIPRILYETNGTKYRYNNYSYYYMNKEGRIIEEDDITEEDVIKEGYVRVEDNDYYEVTETDKNYPAFMYKKEATKIVRRISERIDDVKFIDELDDESFANSFAEDVYTLILLNPYTEHHRVLSPIYLKIIKPKEKLLEKMCRAYYFVKKGLENKKENKPSIPYYDRIKQIMGPEIKKAGGAKRKSKKRSKKHRKTKRRRNTRR